MEALQRETDDLLDDSPTRSKTRGLGSLRRRGQRRAPQSSEAGTAARTPLTAMAESLLSGFEQELTKRIRVLLQRIEIPTRDEIERLEARVTALEEEVRGVSSRVRPDGRPDLRNARRIAKS
jgi:hypothetical protein